MRVPKLCRHRSTGRAYVTDPATGKEEYLGVYGTVEAEAAYGQWVTAYLGRAAPKAPAGSLSVEQLLDSYLDHAEAYYRKHGRATSELSCVAIVCRHVLLSCPGIRASDFTPSKLKEVRARMVSQGYARGSINKHMHRVRRIWRWAVEHELVDAPVLSALEAVAPLAKGRSVAPESEPVRPVPEDDLLAVLAVVKPVIADMVRVQLASAMRPGEIVIMRMCDLDQTSTPWLYTPYTHKTEHAERDKQIWLGPLAREIVAARLRGRSPEATVFAMRGKSHPRQLVNNYRRSIVRACVRAGVELWTPAQLRHTAATAIRQKYGIEGAQVILGHAEANVTQVYAERDEKLAKRIAEEMG